MRQVRGTTVLRQKAGMVGGIPLGTSAWSFCLQRDDIRVALYALYDIRFVCQTAAMAVEFATADAVN